jgi:hypothetical protein
MMNAHFSKRICLALLMMLACAGVITACGLRDVFSRYQTTFLTPVATGTFATTDYRNCPGFPANSNTGALLPPLFIGSGRVGVGYNGQLRPLNEHYVHYMQGAVLFNFDRIPAAAATPLIVATLQFRELRTPRTGLDDPSCEPVNRIERATLAWNPASADFTTDLPSERFLPAPSYTPIGSGGRYECDVSRAVQDWLGDPIAHPNYGFVIRRPDVSFNACSTNIGPPGNLLECAAELRDIVLVVQYLPPGRS